MKDIERYSARYNIDVRPVNDGKHNYKATFTIKTLVLEEIVNGKK